MTDAPNQDLPEDQEPNEDIEPDQPNQDLPDEKQPPRGWGNSRGKDEEARSRAPGQNKPE